VSQETPEPEALEQLLVFHLSLPLSAALCLFFASLRHFGDHWARAGGGVKHVAVPSSSHTSLESYCVDTRLAVQKISRGWRFSVLAENFYASPQPCGRQQFFVRWYVLVPDAIYLLVLIPRVGLGD